MITPLFKATQDENHVILIVRTPHVKAEELDLEVSHYGFKLYVRPYFLSLTFKQPLAEDGKETASWDVGKGEMTIKLPKQTPGQDFDNLNMLTDLLSKPKKSNPPPVGAGLVSEVDVDGGRVDQGGQEGEDDDDDDYNWEVPQQLPREDAAEELLKKVSYGFNNMYQGVFKDRQEFETDIIDVKNPDHTPAAERRRLREDDEDDKMAEDHGQYLFDTLMNQEMIGPVIAYKAPWERLQAQEKDKERGKQAGDSASCGNKDGCFGDEPTFEREIDYAALDEEEEERGCGWDFSHAERDALLKLPRRTYMLSHDEKKRVMVGLVDILFAHCYDVRTTENDPTCESPWTICKLSSTLSWLDTCDSVAHTIATSLRRSLVYPLYRNWDLSCKVVSDVKCIIQLGRVQVLKALLCVREQLHKTSSRYILNNIIIDDYCSWIQSLTESSASKKLASLAQHLDKVKLVKEITAWDLEEIERLARLEMEGGGGFEDEDGEERDDLEVVREAVEKESSSEEEASSSEEESEEEEEESEEEESEEEEVKACKPMVKGDVEIGKGGVIGAEGEEIDLTQAGLENLKLRDDEPDRVWDGVESSEVVDVHPGGSGIDSDDIMGAASDDSDPARLIGRNVDTRRNGESFATMGGRLSSPEAGEDVEGEDGIVELGMSRSGRAPMKFSSDSSEAVEESSQWSSHQVEPSVKPMRGLIEVMSEEEYKEAKTRVRMRQKKMELMSRPSVVSWFLPQASLPAMGAKLGSIGSPFVSANSRPAPKYGGFLG